MRLENLIVFHWQFILETKTMKNNSNLSGALGRMFSLILILTIPLLLPLAIAAQQDQTNQTVRQTVKKKDQSKKADTDKSNSEKSSSPSNQATGDNKSKPLSVNEDPSKIGTRNINKGFTGWLGGSKEKEIALGRQIAAQVEQQSKMLDDPIVTEYVNRVGQNIALHSDVKVPVTIKVIDSDEVNAFALPGGFMFVNKGLILAADNEDELAGVMAHELGHVAARHAMENNGKSQLINYGMLAGIIFGGPIAGQVLYNGGGLLQGLINLKFSRSAEEEADRLGVQYLYSAGYDPTGMATMFEKLAAKDKKKTKGFGKLLIDHPDSLDRRDTSLALVARFPEKEEYVISTSEFQRVKAHLLRLTNAKANVIGDIDDTDSGKPTLKHRQPELSGTTTESTSDGSSSSDTPLLKRRSDSDSTTTDSVKPSDSSTRTTTEKPPQLKRRGGDPSPSPTPNQ